MAKSFQPDIVVGIDIGQTCSGVAYSVGPDWSEPHNLNRWPSQDGIQKADKVATRVGYDIKTGKLINWGFESDFGSNHIEVREQFKLTLDPEYEDDRGITSNDSKRWYADYLSCLYREIQKFFDSSLPNWRSCHVEYIFSTPTTWANPAMIASIEDIIRAAGFANTDRQSLRMGLTEAEAAAIEASSTQYRAGDIFLICDAGGGTTDVNILEVKSAGQRIQLEPLDHVEGVPIGSTLIDFRMSQHIVQRLFLIQGHLEGNPYYLADEMLRGKFEIVKHSFPNPVVPEFTLDVKGLSGTHSFPEAGIINSKMSISRIVLKDIFDEQLAKIFELIDNRLDLMQQETPTKQVSYIILSGGLGSSPYFYEELQKRYQKGIGFSSPVTSSIRMMKVLEPQLAVVRGLVRGRTQQLAATASERGDVFRLRRCRNSFGVVIRAPYDATMHSQIPCTIDPKDQSRWAEDLVDWFIKRGEAFVPEDGVRRAYCASIPPGSQNSPRRVRIVMSTLPPDQLPTCATQAGCKDVASVEYKLTENDMKLKNRQIWKIGRKFWRARFTFVTKFGPADVRFQILGSQGLLSSDHDDLKVDFMDPSSPSVGSVGSNGPGLSLDLK
ncbi:actin-like ATPase domain-containing protein [Myriangium duriaei CBS 260.36]|uniref:Actin-like ATPase domain-containing protein n=1 Tax=Myriangium duriaei CBS 260.36 TaxID=1168546 RepID=A0A9P4ML34_9PEZI|nr:actin-like ATPase domain-containing protein [Myriangium duriaei CBS 260.36]